MVHVSNEKMTSNNRKLVFLMVLMSCCCATTAIRVSLWKRKFHWTPLEHRYNVLMCIVQCLKNPDIDSIHVTKQTSENPCTCLEGKTEKLKKQGEVYVWNKPKQMMADAIMEEVGRSDHLLFLYYSSKSGKSRIVLHGNTDEYDLFTELFMVKFKIYGISIDFPANQVFYGGEAIRRGTLTFKDFTTIYTHEVGQVTVVLAVNVDKDMLYIVQKQYADYSSKEYSFNVLHLDTGRKKTLANVELRTYKDAVIDVKSEMVYYIAKGYKLKSFDFRSMKTKRIGTQLSGVSQRFAVFDNKVLHCKVYSKTFTIFNLKSRSERTFKSPVATCATMAHTSSGELVFVYKNYVTVIDMNGELVRKLDFRHQKHMYAGFDSYEPYVVSCK